MLNCKLKINKKKIIKTAISIISVVLSCAIIVILASQKNNIIQGSITTSDMKVLNNSLSILLNKPKIEGFEPVSETDSFLLYINLQTTNIALLNKLTGEINYSFIPQSKLEEAKPGNDELKSKMLSNFVMNTFIIKSGTEVEYNSYDDSVLDKKFSIKNVPNGIRIDYLIGEIPKERVVPIAISEKRFNEIINTITSSESKEVKDRYKKIDIKQITDSTEKNKYLTDYPLVKDQIIYILRPGLQEFILDKVNAAFLSSGYTIENKLMDEKAVSSNTKEMDLTNVFTVNMEFVLVNDTFSVTIDKSALKHTDKSIPISIDILPYFLATTTKDIGYMLLPDGSGSLINLNNGKTNTSLYSTQIYGQDPVSPNLISEERVLAARLPIYGVKTQKWGIFARISESEAEATIKADISGKTSQINNVYSTFKLRDIKKEVVYRDWKAGAGTIYANRLQNGMLSGKINIDYILLEPEKSDYSNMATIYRGILEKEKVLNKKEEINNNMIINIIGSVDSIKSILGVPTKISNPMTTYKETINISKILREEGVQFDLCYLGGFNGGYKQSIQDNIKFQSELGGEKDFTELNQLIKGYKSKIYLDTSLPFVTINNLFDSFIITRDTCMNISKKFEKSYDVDPVSFYNVELPKYILTSTKIKEIANKLSNNAITKGVDSISLGDIANIVASDFNPENPIFRSQAIKDYEETMLDFTKNNIDLLLSGGNEYALKYANHISEVKSCSNKFRITGESIPFYQMVIHGYIPYSYAPINLQSDPNEIILVSASTGAQISATISYKDTSLLKKTEYSNYYGANWNNSKTIIIDAFNKMKSLNNLVQNQNMEDYEIIADDVTKTSYSGNISVVVNFSGKEYIYQNVKITPRDFAIIGGIENEKK